MQYHFRKRRLILKCLGISHGFWQEIRAAALRTRRRRDDRHSPVKCEAYTNRPSHLRRWRGNLINKKPNLAPAWSSGGRAPRERRCRATAFTIHPANSSASYHIFPPHRPPPPRPPGTRPMGSQHRAQLLRRAGSLRGQKPFRHRNPHLRKSPAARECVSEPGGFSFHQRLDF